MKNYLIQRLDTGEFYRFRAYGNRWVKEREKAKLFKQRCHAGNAITNMRLQGLTAVMRVYLVNITIAYTGDFKDYVYFPPLSTSKVQ